MKTKDSVPRLPSGFTSLTLTINRRTWSLVRFVAHRFYSESEMTPDELVADCLSFACFALDVKKDADVSVAKAGFRGALLMSLFPLCDSANSIREAAARADQLSARIRDLRQQLSGMFDHSLEPPDFAALSQDEKAPRIPLLPEQMPQYEISHLDSAHRFSGAAEALEIIEVQLRLPDETILQFRDLLEPFGETQQWIVLVTTAVDLTLGFTRLAGDLATDHTCSFREDLLKRYLEIRDLAQRSRDSANEATRVIASTEELSEFVATRVKHLLACSGSGAAICEIEDTYRSIGSDSDDSIYAQVIEELDI